LPRPRAPHRAAEAPRRDGRADGRLPERARVPALGAARRRRGGAPALHADDRDARRPGYRRLARRAGVEDALLERLQGARYVVGRASAVLRAPSRRALALAALAAALAVYYSTARSWPNVSTWWDVALLAFGVVPAVFGLVYVALPFWRAPIRQLVAVALALVVAAVAFQPSGLDSLARFAKLGAPTAAA